MREHRVDDLHDEALLRLAQPPDAIDLRNVEVLIEGGVTSFRRYLGGVAMQTVGGGVVQSTRYLFHDHLGSLVKVANPDGSVVEGLDYAAFGGRRHPTDPHAAGWASITTPRGYTGHEMLDDTDVIHMNGRIYDPQLGRFLQPDPLVQAPDSAQSWNACTYPYRRRLAVPVRGDRPVLGQGFRLVDVADTGPTPGTQGGDDGRLAAYRSAQRGGLALLSRYPVTSAEYQQFLNDHHIVSSMSEMGHRGDNAAAERSFGKLKHERINRRRYLTLAQARSDVFDYLERFHNPHIQRRLDTKDQALDPSPKRPWKLGKTPSQRHSSPQTIEQKPPTNQYPSTPGLISNHWYGQ